MSSKRIYPKEFNPMVQINMATPFCLNAQVLYTLRSEQKNTNYSGPFIPGAMPKSSTQFAQNNKIVHHYVFNGQHFL